MMIANLTSPTADSSVPHSSETSVYDLSLHLQRGQMLDADSKESTDGILAFLIVCSSFERHFPQTWGLYLFCFCLAIQCSEPKTFSLPLTRTRSSSHSDQISLRILTLTEPHYPVDLSCWMPPFSCVFESRLYLSFLMSSQLLRCVSGS